MGTTTSKTEQEMAALLAAHTKHTGTDCTWAKALGKIEPARREIVERWMGDRDGVPASTIADVVAELSELKVTRGMVGRHRNNECVNCGR